MRLSSLLLLIYLFLLTDRFIPCKSAKILFFNSKGEGSHYFAAASLGEELASRGHSVTFILADHYMFRAEHPVHSQLFTFKSVPTYSSFKQDFQTNMEDVFKVALEGKNILFTREVLETGVELEVRYCEMLFQEDLLASLRKESFDAVLFDPIWPCATGLSEYLGGARIALIPTTLSPVYLRAMNTRLNPAVTVELGMGLPSKMNFFQRFQNLAMAVFYELLGTYVHDMPYDHILRPYNISGYKSSMQKVDFVITAADPIIDKVVPMYPNHGIAAGLTVTPAKALDKVMINHHFKVLGLIDIQDIMTTIFR